MQTDPLVMPLAELRTNEISLVLFCFPPLQLTGGRKGSGSQGMNREHR